MRKKESNRVSVAQAAAELGLAPQGLREHMKRGYLNDIGDVVPALQSKSGKDRYDFLIYRDRLDRYLGKTQKLESCGRIGGGFDMAIKGVRTIAEYAIRRWLADQNFAMECFTLAMNGNEGTLTDQDGDSLVIAYDSMGKTVCVKEE